MGNSQDEELVRKCRRGDRRALEVLLERYQKPIFNAAFRMLGNSEDASDVTQTAFLKAFENLERYNPSYKFFGWIYRIAINEAIDRINSGKREQVLHEDQTSPIPEPDKEAQADDVSRTVQGALMRLQQDYRAVIVLRHFSECTYQEIGEILHIPEKTVKSRLYSARQKMKDQLESEGLI